MSKFFWKSVLTCFGLGLLPKAPGTWGSLGALVFWGWLLYFSSLSVYLGLFVGFFILSVLAMKILNIKEDDSSIVVDEWLGMAIALLPTQGSWWMMILAFVLFRIFDISKPPGVRFFDQNFLRGWGVLLDDVVAGFYVFLILGAYHVWFSPL